MKIGDCFMVESSYGDDGPTWMTYRRIRFAGSQIAECCRFETRPSQMTSAHELVLRPADPIGLDVLAKQTSISVTDWQAAYETFLNRVTEPWNVE